MKFEDAAVQAHSPARVLSVPVPQSLAGTLPAPQASARQHRTLSPLRQDLQQALYNDMQGSHRQVRCCGSARHISQSVCTNHRGPTQHSASSASSAPGRGRGAPQAWRTPAPASRGRTPVDQGRGRGGRRSLQMLPVQVRPPWTNALLCGPFCCAALHSSKAALSPC